MAAHLLKANSMAGEVRKALEAYQSAVATLLERTK
jgi:hypothetical protein